MTGPERRGDAETRGRGDAQHGLAVSPCRRIAVSPRPRGFELIVVGASAGGAHALQVVLAALPPRFALPVAVVLHRGPGAPGALAAQVQRRSALPVAEPEDKEAIVPGRVYLAPADYHLLVEPGCFALSTEAPVNHARPSIDVLFESAADAYGAQVVGVVLTGLNADGARGLAVIKQRGGLALVQDPATAEHGAMPAAAIAAAPVDKVLPLEELGAFLASQCAGPSPPPSPTGRGGDSPRGREAPSPPGRGRG